MWTYLKDFVIGKLISKWIIEAEALSLDQNSPYFQHYKNIKLNPESAQTLLSGYKIVEGSAEELSVEVDWMELLKYWTEIKSKYHIEEQPDDEDEDESSLLEVLYRDDNRVRCSEVKIKNLNLRIETQLSSPVVDVDDPDVDVDLLRDFLNHVISQFKVKIDGITLIINDKITLKCKDPITVHSETNGIRRIQLPEIRIEAGENVCVAKKGSEISITRNIESFKVKVQIPEIDLDLEDVDDIMNLLNAAVNPSKKRNPIQSSGSFSFEISCDLLIIVFQKDIKAIINDIYFNETGEFITGHFSVKWKGLVLLNSPVQTQVIRGNFRESKWEIDEELEITIEKFVMIEEIMKLYKGAAVNNNNNNNNSNTESGTGNNIRLRALGIRIEGYQVIIDGLTAEGSQINVKAIDLIHQNSQFLLENIKFTLGALNNSVTPFPFAELKRFIENDEIISLEKKEVLYSWFTESNRLKIQKAIGKISIDDIPSSENYTNTSKSPSSLTVIGIINELDLEIVLTDYNVYQLKMANFEFLKASDSFFDFRSNLETLKRNNKILIESGQVNCTAAKEFVVEIENLQAKVPYNLVDLLTLDMSQLQSQSRSEMKGGSNEHEHEHELQVVIRNFSFDLEGPEPNEPIDLKSQFKITEVTIKMDTARSITIYMDDLRVDLDDCSVFNSGLLKITSDPALTIRNYCSHVTLTPDSFEKLKRFVKYWTEIYSPIIQEIVPEAIYFRERGADETDTVDDKDTAINVGQVKDKGTTYYDTTHDTAHDAILCDTITVIKDEDENLELELDIDIEDLLPSFTEMELSSFKLYEPTPQMEGKQQDLKELLNEIDEEFFLNKKETTKTQSTDRCIKIIDFGVEIKLILPETETGAGIETGNEFKISLKEINGTISSDSIEFKVKEGGLVEIKKSKSATVVILGRWQKGPDVTCKYPIEDGNFLRILAERNNIDDDARKSQKGIDEYNLIISLCPLRLFLDQKSLNSLCKFGNGSSSGDFPDPNKNSKNKTAGEMRGFIFFNKVNISALALKLDYNPNASSYLSPPLQGAEIVLPRIELRGIKGLGGLGPAILATWIPELKGSKLTGVLKTGLVPVRTVVNLGGGMVELILLPWQLGTRDLGSSSGSGGSAAQTVAHIRRTSKQIGLETLKLTTSLANQTSKFLGSSSGTSSTQGYPPDFQSGVQQAAQLIIALPTRIHQQSQRKSALRAVPLLILDSASTATGALAKTLQGIQAEFDRETGIDRKLKQKHHHHQQQ